MWEHKGGMRICAWGTKRYSSDSLQSLGVEGLAPRAYNQRPAVHDYYQRAMYLSSQGYVEEVAFSGLP